MLEAAAAMAPSLSELNYSTMIPSSSPSSLNTLHFAEGPRFALHNDHGNSIHNHHHHQLLVDPVNMLRFPVTLNDHHHHRDQETMLIESLSASGSLNHKMAMNNTATATCLDSAMNNTTKRNENGKRKRARTAKTSEEAENQRMTHIAVERKRRKLMNEHLGVLRSLMPASFIQRGDQASIVGGAIEFVRELEQILQCLESQKRPRLNGEVAVALPLSNSQYFGPNTDDFAVNSDSLMMNMAPNSSRAGLREETAGNKSAIADVEVKLVGFDAFIKILTRRRPGQLIKAISGLQELEFTILHTNVSTIEQTVLYSFNVKIGSKRRLRANDIAVYQLERSSERFDISLLQISETKKRKRVKDIRKEQKRKERKGRNELNRERMIYLCGRKESHRIRSSPLPQETKGALSPDNLTSGRKLKSEAIRDILGNPSVSALKNILAPQNVIKDITSSHKTAIALPTKQPVGSQHLRGLGETLAQMLFLNPHFLPWGNLIFRINEIMRKVI
ncbi:hypothetical protein V2J09_024102 [Rumex salicifolius]